LSNSGQGIQLSGSDNFNTLTGNECKSNSGAGIYSDSPACVFANNACQNNAGAGVELSGFDETVIGNICYYNGQDGIAFYSCTESIISNNVCNYNSWDGIYLDGSSDNNRIISNQAAFGNGDYNFENLGTNNDVAHNYNF
jgi:parallel beta-helix repeat protein